MDDATQGRDPDRERTFRAVYEAVYPDLLRFAQRRTASAPHADDVVADTFLVVWRRLDELPREDGAARAWVFGIARTPCSTRAAASSAPSHPLCASPTRDWPRTRVPTRRPTAS